MVIDAREKAKITSATDPQADAYEARYHSLLQHVPLGIFYTDTEHTCVDANERICNMLGYSNSELIGMKISDIVGSEVAEIEAAFSDLARADMYRCDWIFRRRDGSTFIGEVIATRPEDSIVLGMVQDITEKRRYERELLRMTRLYDALSHINQAIVNANDNDETRLFERICRILVERGGLQMAWIGRHEPAARELESIADYGDVHGYLERATLFIGAETGGRLGALIELGQTYVSNDLLSDPVSSPRHELHRECGFRAATMVSIMRADAVH
ncbi:MAG: PAS domain S-box protein, partial [Haliea sp.]